MIKHESHPLSWKLMLGDSLLGTLVFKNYDFPWTYCTLQSTADFNRYRKFFTDEDTWDDKDTELDNVILEIKEKGLTLVPEDGSEIISKFRLNVDANEAWFR